MSEFTELLQAGLSGAGFHSPLTETQLEQLETHYLLLKTWNQKINLTSIRTLDESVRRHYVECLYFASFLARFADEGSYSALDAGSGAGFPGIPMAILLPHWEISLIESDQRKAVFLREAARSLPNVKVISMRLEQVEKPAEWLVSRAVRPESVLKQVPRLASRVGLLLGPDGWAEVQQDARFHWLPPVVLPSGDQMYAVFGNCTD